MKQFTSHQNWTRRQALWFMTGSLAGIGLHACTKTDTPSVSQSTGSSSPANSDSLALGITTWIGNTPIYIAQEKGFFKEQGLDLKIQVFETVAAGFPAYLSGRLQGLAPVTSEAVALASQGADFRVVVVEDTSVGADVILARNSIGSIKDFKGKKIGVELGGIGHFFLLQILAQAGLTEKDVTLTNAPPDTAAAAYQSGNLEIVYTYSPFSDKAIAAQKDGRVIYSSKQMPTAIADLYIFNNQWLQSHPQAVTAFTSGHFKGLQFLKNNPKEGLAIMAKRLNITPQELEQQLKGIQIPDLTTNLAMLGNPQSNLSLLKPMTELATFLKAQGKISKVPDLSKTLDSQFVTALKAKA